MSGLFDRRRALCNQDLTPGPGPQPYTGIDFVRVDDHATQDVLHVYFIVDPALVEIKSSPGTRVAVPGDAFPVGDVEIAGAEPGYASQSVEVAGAIWRENPDTNRTYLEITLANPGDFSNYELRLRHDQIDRHLASSVFSFKAACPSDFDCDIHQDCPKDSAENIAVDYLARDFESFRDAVLAFLARRFPLWREPIVADMGVMLLETLCALADEFSYMQDRISRESTLSTAREPRSVHAHARLLDYRPDMGRNARGTAALTLASGQSINIAKDASFPGLRAWASTSSGQMLAFEAELSGPPDPDSGFDHYWMHGAWNRLPLEVSDRGAACLERGATSLALAPISPPPGSVLPYRSPLDGNIDPLATRPDLEEFWRGRTMVLAMDPDDPSRPHRRWEARITHVEVVEDELKSAQLGVDYMVTILHWSDATPLPRDYSKADSHVLLNTVEMKAGEVVETLFRVGEVPDASWAAEAPAAILREGPCYAGEAERSHFVRFGLEDTLRSGLAFDRQGRPEITVRHFDDVLSATDPGVEWPYIDGLQEADAQQAAFDVEAGFWGPIRNFERWDGQTSHRVDWGDYASPRGFTLLFGDGFTGRQPEPGTAFRVRYRLNPGASANLPADTLLALSPPGEDDILATLAPIEGITNPLPFSGGRDPEPLESIRLRAPEAFRALPQRAVRAEDFTSILGRIDRFQAVGAQQRWTGSWLTRFVTADPVGAQSLDDESKDILFGAANAVRMVGRHVAVTDPLYVTLSLRVFVCLEDGTYSGDIVSSVETRLSEHFHPDNVVFGQPLARSSLEAIIQSTPGVRGVDSIWFRTDADLSYRRLESGRLSFGPDSLIRLHNDPRFPHMGHVSVYDHAKFESVMGTAGAVS